VKKNFFDVILISMTLIVGGCATSNIPSNSTSPALPKPLDYSRAQSSPSIEELENLQKQLGLQRDFNQLGYFEKPFETCEDPQRGAKACHRNYFIVIHFQLLCRDTEGTVSEVVTQNDVKPISDQTVVWNLKGNKGDIQTDPSGFGQIRTIASVSPRTQRLKLAVRNEALYLRAGEINRVVTPRPWCNP
jgi:hypothetical protein